MKRISIGGVICLLIAVVLMLILRWDEGKAQKDFPEIAKNIIETDGATVAPENNGKLVLIKGNIKLEKETITDPAFHVTLATPQLIRVVREKTEEEIQLSSAEVDQLSQTEKNKLQYRWGNYYKTETKWETKPQTNFTLGMNANAIPYQSLVFTNKTFLGAFEIADFSLFKLNNLTKSYEKPQMIGNLEISFRYVDLKPMDAVTILAKQRDNTLEEYKLSSGTAVASIWPGNINKNEVMNLFIEGQASRSFAYKIIIGVFGLLGAFLIISRIKKSFTMGLPNLMNKG